MLRDEALKQGRWRQTPEGHIEKGPFPAERTSVNVTPLGTNRDSGETSLSLTPRNAGDSPRVYVGKSAAVSAQDDQVHDLEDYRTDAATLYFIAVDSAGKYQVGEPTRWTADLTVRHEVHKVADTRKVELRCTPAAELRYTLDGTNPKEGTLYAQPFAVPAKGCTILIAAKAGEVEKSAKIQIPSDGDDRVIIDDRKPARLAASKRVSTTPQTRCSTSFSASRIAATPCCVGFRSSWAKARARFRSASTTASSQPPLSRPRSVAFGRRWGTSRPRCRS